MIDRLAVLAQFLMPKKGLTIFAGWVASAQAGMWTIKLIEWFVKRYNVNMSEALNPDITSYLSFNDFFTRALKADARPLSVAQWICPVDGAISQFGAILEDQIFQAKNHSYTTTSLVGGDESLARLFRNGSFATLYLSPSDYHRVHMPIKGKLKRMIYVPGELFSVNPKTAEWVPGLFARNERVVCEFITPLGPFVMILVGATIVGSMSLDWHGVVNAKRNGEILQWLYEDKEIVLNQGQEMGRFLLGSTVVLLFPSRQINFQPHWEPKGLVHWGQAMSVI